jgi:hypothetical protein
VIAVTLIEIVRQLHALDSNDTIYAKMPWTNDSECVVLSERDSPPPSFEYFMEVFIARDFLDDWATSLGAVPSAIQRCSRLIQYAINDA